MPNYTFCSYVTASAYTTVEADSIEEAKEMIKDRGVILADFNGDSNEFWLIEEADGEPFNIFLFDISE